MRFALVTLGCLGLCTLARPSMAADTVTLSDCWLGLDAEVQLPAQEAGVLLKIETREGQPVRRGDLLAQIDDALPKAQRDVAQYKLQVAEKQATDDVDVKYAKAAFDYATSKVRRDKAANDAHPGTVTEEAVDEHKLERRKFELSIEKAQKDMDVARLQKNVSTAELQAADAKLKQHVIAAPLDAVVVELLKHEGEWVQAGETVMRLVRVDVLRVEGVLNIKDYLPSDVQDRPVQVVVSLPQGRRVTFPGKIVFVKPLAQAGGIFQVRAEVQNRPEGNSWVLMPGQHAEMTIQLK